MDQNSTEPVTARQLDDSLLTKQRPIWLEKQLHVENKEPIMQCSIHVFELDFEIVPFKNA